MQPDGSYRSPANCYDETVNGKMAGSSPAGPETMKRLVPFAAAYQTPEITFMFLHAVGHMCLCAYTCAHTTQHAVSIYIICIYIYISMLVYIYINE